MEEIMNIFINNGVGVACLIYFMYFNKVQMEKNTNAINDLKMANIELINEIKNLISKNVE